MSSYVDGVYAPDLGFGAAFALWGFRACARGQARCCCVAEGFRQTFKADGLAVLAALLGLARVLGAEGHRKLCLAWPGCAGVTADELSIVAALAAAQAQDGDALDAHLAWLMGGAPHGRAVMAADHIGHHFRTRGLDIRRPEIGVSSRTAATFGFVVHAGGRA